MIELEIKMRGGKNLARLDWRDREYLRRELPPMAKKIRDRVLKKGATADGRPLPRYSRRTASAREKQGLPVSRVTYSQTRAMWRSLVLRVTSKGKAVAGFSKGRRTAAGEKAKIKQKKRDGTVRERSLTNQYLATLLSFRQPGKPFPVMPRNFVPRFAYMDLDEANARRLEARYEPYWRRKVANAPPALK